jgi:hypothetical protein
MHFPLSRTLLALALPCISVGVLAQNAQPAKFIKSNQAKFAKACGDNLDEHSACGDCAYVQGVGVTTSARCGHVCVTLPAGKAGSDMNVIAQAAEDSLVPSFQQCGSTNTAGSCTIHWARFEGNEYYPDKNQLCGRFKNWSADRERIFRIVVTEK